MRVVFITPMDPFNVGGGAISAYRFIEPLKSLYRKGKIDDYKIIYLKKSDTAPVEDTDKFLYFPKRRLDRVRTAFRLNASPLELHSEEILSVLTKFNPNVIIMHYSTLGNLSKQIRKSLKNVKIAQNFDNLEAKTVELSRSPIKVLANLGMKALLRKSEKFCLTTCNLAVFFENKQAQLVMSFYKIQKPYLTMPLTLGNSYEKSSGENPKRNMTTIRPIRLLFTGMLDVWFNTEAIRFLVDNIATIRDVINKNGVKSFELVIAGKTSGKAAEIVEGVSNLVVAPNPSKEEMDRLFTESDVFISPVFFSTGMKTKILEALYHGLPVVSSKTSLIGFEDDLQEVFGKYIFPFTDRDKMGFAKALNDAVLEILRNNSFDMRKEIIKIYNEKYGLERFESIIQQICVL